jgi:hypothetical protein
MSVRRAVSIKYMERRNCSSVVCSMSNETVHRRLGRSYHGPNVPIRMVQLRTNKAQEAGAAIVLAIYAGALIWLDMYLYR